MADRTVIAEIVQKDSAAGPFTYEITSQSTQRGVPLFDIDRLTGRVFVRPGATPDPTRKAPTR